MNYGTQNRNTSKRKKISAFVTLILALLLVLTGTFAWQDYNQHKSNEFSTAKVDHSVVLIENFQPVTEWKKGESKQKEVYVRNGQETDPTGTYDNAYVRLQIREYMDIAQLVYNYGPTRYMIDTQGEFIRAKNESELKEYIDNNSSSLPGVNYADIEQAESAFDDGNAPVGGYYYIKTKQGDVNGQYGKYIVESIDESVAEPVIENTQRADETELDVNHHKPGSSEECGYPLHNWVEDENHNLIPQNKISTDYVDLVMDRSKVITLGEYEKLSTKQKEVGYWVLDTSQASGWAYWSKPLIHGVEGKDETHKLIEAVTLKEQPKDKGYYVLHVDMEAVSFDELWRWDDLPSDLGNDWGKEDFFGNIKVRLKDSGKITQGEKHELIIESRDINGNEFVDYDINIESSDPTTKVVKENGIYKLFVGFNEEGPITITVTPKNAEDPKGILRISTESIEDSKVMIDGLPKILATNNTYSFTVKGAGSNPSVVLTGNSEVGTRINNGKLIIDKMETNTPLTITVTPSETNTPFVFDLDVAIAKSIKGINIAENQSFERGKTYRLEAETQGDNIEGANKGVNWFIESAFISRTNGITLTEEGLLTIGENVPIGQTFEVVAKSKLNDKITKSFDDLIVSASIDEIDRVELEHDTDFMPGNDVNLTAKFYSGSSVLDIEGYEIVLTEVQDNLSLMKNVDGSYKLSIFNSFRDSPIKLTVKLNKPIINKEFTFAIDEVLSVRIDNPLDNTSIERKTNDTEFNYTVDTIGNVSNRASILIEKDGVELTDNSIKIIEKSNQKYIDISENAKVGDYHITVISDVDASKNDTIKITVKNNLKDKEVHKIDKKPGAPETGIPGGPEIDIGNNVETENGHGSGKPSIDPQLRFYIEQKVSSDTVVDEMTGMLTIGVDEPEGDVIVRVETLQTGGAAPYFYTIAVQPEVKRIEVHKDNHKITELNVVAGDFAEVEVFAFGEHHPDKLVYPEVELTFKTGSGETNGSKVEKVSGEKNKFKITLSALEPEGSFILVAKDTTYNVETEIILNVVPDLTGAYIDIENPLSKNLVIGDASNNMHDFEFKLKDSTGTELTTIPLTYEIVDVKGSGLVADSLVDGVLTIANEQAESSFKIKVSAANITVTTDTIHVVADFDNPNPRPDQKIYLKYDAAETLEQGVQHPYGAHLVQGTAPNEKPMLTKVEFGSLQGSNIIGTTRIDDGVLYIDEAQPETDLTITMKPVGHDEPVETDTIKVRPAVKSIKHNDVEKDRGTETIALSPKAYSRENYDGDLLIYPTFTYEITTPVDDAKISIDESTGVITLDANIPGQQFTVRISTEEYPIVYKDVNIKIVADETDAVIIYPVVPDSFDPSVDNEYSIDAKVVDSEGHDTGIMVVYESEIESGSKLTGTNFNNSTGKLTIDPNQSEMIYKITIKGENLDPSKDKVEYLKIIPKGESFEFVSTKKTEFDRTDEFTYDVIILDAQGVETSREVEFSIRGENDAQTTITKTGKLTIGNKEEAGTITVTMKEKDGLTPEETFDVTVTPSVVDFYIVKEHEGETIPSEMTTGDEFDFKSIVVGKGGQEIKSYTPTYTVTGQAGSTSFDNSILKIAANEHAVTLTVTIAAPNSGQADITKSIDVVLEPDRIEFDAIANETILKPGDESHNFAAKVVDVNGNKIHGSTVTYTVIDNVDPNTKVESNGKLKVGIKEHEKVITVKMSGSGKEAETTFKVVPDPFKVKVNNPSTASTVLPGGGKHDFEVEILGEYDQPLSMGVDHKITPEPKRGTVINGSELTLGFLEGENQFEITFFPIGMEDSTIKSDIQHIKVRPKIEFIDLTGEIPTESVRPGEVIDLKPKAFATGVGELTLAEGNYNAIIDEPSLATVDGYGKVTISDSAQNGDIVNVTLEQDGIESDKVTFTIKKFDIIPASTFYTEDNPAEYGENILEFVDQNGNPVNDFDLLAVNIASSRISQIVDGKLVVHEDETNPDLVIRVAKYGVVKDFDVPTALVEVFNIANISDSQKLDITKTFDAGIEISGKYLLPSQSSITFEDSTGRDIIRIVDGVLSFTESARYKDNFDLTLTSEYGSKAVQITDLFVDLEIESIKETKVVTSKDISPGETVKVAVEYFDKAGVKLRGLEDIPFTITTNTNFPEFNENTKELTMSGYYNASATASIRLNVPEFEIAENKTIPTYNVRFSNPDVDSKFGRYNQYSASDNTPGKISSISYSVEKLGASKNFTSNTVDIKAVLFDMNDRNNTDKYKDITSIMRFRRLASNNYEFKMPLRLFEGYDNPSIAIVPKSSDLHINNISGGRILSPATILNLNRPETTQSSQTSYIFLGDNKKSQLRMRTTFIASKDRPNVNGSTSTLDLKKGDTFLWSYRMPDLANTVDGYSNEFSQVYNHEVTESQRTKYKLSTKSWPEFPDVKYVRIPYITEAGDNFSDYTKTNVNAFLNEFYTSRIRGLMGSDRNLVKRVRRIHTPYGGWFDITPGSGVALPEPTNSDSSTINNPVIFIPSLSDYAAYSPSRRIMSQDGKQIERVGFHGHARPNWLRTYWSDTNMTINTDDGSSNKISYAPVTSSQMLVWNMFINIPTITYTK